MESAPHAPSHSVAVVDDDPTCTLMLDRILSRAGYRVTVYTSGEALLAALPANPHDVVCLDLSLPGIDGLETLRQLTATHPGVPVILFTASAETVAAEALSAGAHAVVPKTGAWVELRHALDAAIRRRS